MKEDIKYGWSDAPKGSKCDNQWCCPDCGKLSNIELWEYCETDCEDCGTHEARKCPLCEHCFDGIWESGEIYDATIKVRQDVKR